MNILTRRLLYSLAIFLFLVSAPLVVAVTAGYRWQGWPTGFIRTGVVVITSQPRAEVRINGRSYGLTPKKISGLLPGLMTVELSRAGYRGWTKVIDLDARTAQIIGPVKLFLTAFRPTTLSTATGPWLATAAPPTVSRWETSATAVVGRQIWPADNQVAAAIPWPPQAIAVGPRNQITVWSADDQQAVTVNNAVTEPWLIERADRLAWTDQSDYIWFGQRHRECRRYDLVTQTVTPVGPCDSLAVDGDELWSAVVTDDRTALYRQPVLTPEQPQLVDTFTGVWELLAGHNGQLLIRQTDTGQARALNYDALTKRLSLTELGSVDKLFWADGGQPPIWVDGVDLKSLIDDRVILLERDPVSPVAVYWLDAPDILIMADADQVAIKSVSQAQGRETLLSAPRPKADGVLVIVPDRKIIVLEDADGRLISWSWAD